MNDNVPNEPQNTTPAKEGDAISLDTLERNEAWRLLIAVLKTVGGRVAIKRDMLYSIDINQEEVRFGPISDAEISLQVGNGLRG